MVSFEKLSNSKSFNKPKIVGILNLTPDSFSDGGKFNQQNFALTHLQKMLIDGADIIDVGAESTRPNAQVLTASQEIFRLEKILPKIVDEIKKFNHSQHKNIEISIDTYHFETLVFAHSLGINFINDVSGLIDEKIIDFVATKNLKAILMHNLAIHADPNIIINRELNVFEQISQWAQQKIAFLEANNIKKSQLIFDPGIGFSKDPKQSIRILKNIEAYRHLGLKIYVGHSKKSFLDYLKIPNQPNLDRAQKTLIISQYLAHKKVDYLRVHDVLENFGAINKAQDPFVFEH